MEQGAVIAWSKYNVILHMSRWWPGQRSSKGLDAQDTPWPAINSELRGVMCGDTEKTTAL